MTKLFRVLIFLFFTVVSFAQSGENTISGIVTDYGQPLPRANISIKGTTEGIQTDAKGKYSLTARPRDILVFSYVGMKTVEVVVEDVTKTLNIAMQPQIQELDEVVVEQKKRENQEQMLLDYGKKKTIIRTSFGYIDTENAGYAVNSIDGSELNPSAIDIVTALQAKLPGTRIVDFGTGGQTGGLSGKGILIRGGGSANNPRPAIYEVDGTIFESAPDFLIIDNIDRVAVLPGLAAVTRYGNIAGGGVIIINTKGAKIVKREKGSNKVYDQARRRDNVYNKNSTVSKFKREAPKYVLELRAATSVAEATAIFDKQKAIRGSSPYYYLEAFNFFRTKWKDSGMDATVLEEMKAKHGSNPNALKALAYTFEELGDLKAAMALYVEVFKKRPSYGQSYRDLANSYTENGNYKKALGLYARYQKSRALDTVTGDFEGIDAIIEAESNNLLTLRTEELSMESGSSENGEYNGIRVVFEWNNSEAEFDIQFVNPENQYSLWKHTYEEESDRITDEKMKGYSCAQFLIDKSLPGKWQMNIKYFGNKSYEPTYLKATVYYDYGTPSQRKQLKVFKLSQLNLNTELFSVMNPAF